MNMIKFIKQAQSLDSDNLLVLIDALSIKYKAAKYGSLEEANIKAQMDAVCSILSKRARHHW